MMILVGGAICVGLYFLAQPLFEKLKKVDLFTVDDWKHSINRYFYEGHGGVSYADAKWRAKPFYNKKGLFVMKLEGIPNDIIINDNVNDGDCDIRIKKDQHGLFQRIDCRVDAFGNRYAWNSNSVRDYNAVVRSAEKDAKNNYVEEKIREAELKDKLEGDPLNNSSIKGKYNKS